MSVQEMFDKFAPATKEDWAARALQDLRGKPLEELVSHWQELTVEPYYTCEDLAGQRPVPLLARQPDWINYVPVAVTDEQAASEQARHHLQHGATGIWFRLEREADTGQLLKGIEPAHCALAFSGPMDAGSLRTFLAATLRQNPKATIRGFADQPEITPIRVAPGFFPTLIGSRNPTGQDDLLSILLSLYRQLATADTPPNPDSIAYRVNMPVNYLLGIVRLRALRILLSHFWQAYEQPRQPADFYLVAVSPAWREEAYGPHENMLKATTAGMAAVVGGCNALCIEPASGHEQEVLVARNVSLILRYEAYLDKVADPAAGSYFFESLTARLVRQLWRAFLQHVQEDETEV